MTNLEQSMKMKTTLIIFALVLVAFYMVFKDHPSFIKFLPADAILPDNSRYYGGLKDGLFDGPGEIIWSDGSRYVGHFKQGLMDGSG